MAAQSYIHKHEATLIDAINAANELIEAAKFEVVHMDGKLYEENDDSWGTTCVNAIVLRSKLFELIDTIQLYRHRNTLIEMGS